MTNYRDVRFSQGLMESSPGKARVLTLLYREGVRCCIVADTDDLCRDLLFFSDHDIYRKQIFAAAPAFLTDTEYLLDGELLSFV